MENLAQLLGAFGYETRVAFDGPRALAALETFTPDVALVDLGLPVMDGFELARRLRALPSLEGTKLVALTGYGQDSDRARAAASGFVLHLVKPVELPDLTAAIESLRGERRARA